MLILALTLTSGKISSNMGIEHLDKVVHAFLFCSLSFLLVVANRKQDLPEIKYSAKKWAIGVCFLFGSMVECIQIFIPSRDFEVLDILSNTFGAFVGLLVFLIVYRS